MRKSVFVLALLAVFAPFDVFAQGVASPPAETVLNPGDAVKISVWRKPELSGEFFVSADGSIADPFYSGVKVAGIPFTTAEERIRELVGSIETSPRVWIEPLYRVTVGGEVRQPNVLTLRRETTVAQAVAQAGGVTVNGRLEKVRLMRQGAVFQVDLTDPANEMARSAIRSGDEILVARHQNLFSEYIAPSASVVTAAGILLGLLIN